MHPQAARWLAVAGFIVWLAGIALWGVSWIASLAVSIIGGGMQRSGRIVTAAAILIAVVFGAFITSSVTNIKLLGLGVALAILIDATIIRGVIVPAFMRIAGKWNWWAPAWLRKVHDKVGLTD